MQETDRGEKPLSSWKEIAAYLGCDRRTCIRWEKNHGLPVHRPSSDRSRSHVFAYKREVDDWLKKRSGPPGIREELSPKPRLSRLTIFVFISLLFAGLSLLVYLFVIHGPFQKRSSLLTQPADFKVRGSELVVLNSKGEELWKYDTHLDALEDESIYRNHFQVRQFSPSALRTLPTLIIEDIDKDGLKEVLFVPMTRDFSHYGDLICFSSTGQIKWSFGPERRITYGQTQYDNDFFFYGLGLLPNDSYKNRAKIIVFGQHFPNFPTFVDVLTVRGQKVGEYWNAGRFLDYGLADLNNDARMELVLVGTNNEYGKGCLVGLDPADMRGGSPQSGSYYVRNMEAGSEMSYLLFPRTLIDELDFSPRGTAGQIEVLASGRMAAIAGFSNLVFELNDRFVVERVIISDTYKEKYNRFQAEGKIAPGPLDEPRLASELQNSVLYFDGVGWTKTPAPHLILSKRRASPSLAIR